MKKKEEIYLIEKVGDIWSKATNITATSGIEGGYFYWLSESEIYFQSKSNEGDIVQAKLKNNTLIIDDYLSILNTENGTEFSPYVDADKLYIIFTRYLEGDKSNQGFFVSYNKNNFENPRWSIPTKLKMLPYGWNAYVKKNTNQFLYTNGEDIYSMHMSFLKLK